MTGASEEAAGGAAARGGRAHPARLAEAHAGRARPARLAAVALGAFALALVARAVRLPLVITPDGVDFPYLGDLFYHARRIWFSVVNFPEVLRFDPYVSYPDGAEIVWTGAFDLAIAGLARALVGADDPSAAEAVAIWVPPLVGAATAALAAWLTARLYGVAAGAWAGAIFALLPASFVFSQLGQLDHHFAVAFLATGALAATLALLRSASWPRALGFGAALAALVGLWPGALVHALVLQAGAAAWMLGSEGAERAAQRARRLAAGHALAAATLAPFGLGRTWEAYGSWSPWVLCNFQPVWFAAGAAGLAAAAWIFGRTPAGATPARRLGAVAGLAAAGALVALAALPELRASLAEASGWFRQAEAFQEHVNELRPLLTPKGRLDLRPVVSELGLFAPLFPVALAGLALARRRAWRAEDALLLFFAAAFLALTLNQRRFVNTFGVPYAMVWGAAIAAAGARLRRAPAVPRAAGAAVGGLFLLAALASLVVYHVPFVAQSVAAWRGAEPPRNGFRAQQLLFERAARFLAAATPPTRGYLDPSVQPEYGVLSNWGAGHLLRYRAERPMVQDNFGVYGGRRTFERAWDYFAAHDESEAVAIARELRVRYVVADALGAGSREPYPPDAMARRLAQNFGSERELPRGHGRVAALHHHRLLFHTSTSPLETLVTPLREPTVAVWEIVPGALAEGTAPPGREVVATLPLATAEGRSHAWRASTRADEAGRWRLLLPYPTGVDASVRTGAAYRLVAGEFEAALAVADTAVRRGLRIDGPDLRPAGAPTP